MAEIPNRMQGNNDVPKQSQVAETIEWVTKDEAESLDKLLFKSFNRKIDRKKGDREKYFYKVVGSHPFVPAMNSRGEMITTQTNQHLVKLEVRKFFRKEMIDSVRRENGQEITEKVNKPVEWVTLDNMGNGQTLDEDACFFIESREFQKTFERDREE